MANATLRKGRDGWTAESSIPLEAPYELHISTMKRSRGGISSIATRVKRSDDGMGISFTMFHDYSKTQAEDRAARCTEKTIREMHAGVLARADAIKADVAAFYAAKGAQ